MAGPMCKPYANMGGWLYILKRHLQVALGTAVYQGLT